MSIDYREVKKGIKNAELDRINYNVYSVLSLIAGCIAGAIAHNLIVGIVVFSAGCLWATRKYYEIGK
jgi:hypothetical protein